MIVWVKVLFFIKLVKLLCALLENHSVNKSFQLPFDKRVQKLISFRRCCKITHDSDPFQLIFTSKNWAHRKKKLSHLIEQMILICLARTAFRGLYGTSECFSKCRLALKTECLHLTSRRPYWYPKTIKRRRCWCSKQTLWELNSFPMQTLSFVPINLYSCWPREWKRSIHNTSDRFQWQRL